MSETFICIECKTKIEGLRCSCKKGSCCISCADKCDAYTGYFSDTRIMPTKEKLPKEQNELKKLKDKCERLEKALKHVDFVLDTDDGYGLLALQEYVKKALEEK